MGGIIFLFFLLGLVGFLYLNNKISTLERIIRSSYSDREKIKPVDNPTNSPTNNPTVNSPNPYSVASSDVRDTGEAHGEVQSGKILGFVGIFAILAGIIFFYQYAVQNGWLNPAARVVTGYLAGVLLLAIGQYLRNKYRKYSDLLMGGGIGVFYIATYAGSALYKLELFSGPFYFAFLIAITALSIWFSVKDASQTFGIVGIVGAFMALFFTANKEIVLMPFYVYLTILSLGSLGVSLWKKWINFNYVAFLGTGLMFVYSMGAYKPENLGMTMTFLSLFFLIYLISSIAHHIVRKEQTRTSDVVLIVLNSLGYFIIARSIIHDQYENLESYLAIVLACLYWFVGYVAHITNSADKVLNYTLPAVGTIFFTMAIPLLFDGPTITYLWLLEAAGLYIISFVIKNPQLHPFGAAIYGIALFRVLFVIDGYGDRAFLNGWFISVILTVVLSYLVAYLHRVMPEVKRDNEDINVVKGVFIVAGSVLFLYGVSHEIYRFFTVYIPALPGLYTGVGGTSAMESVYSKANMAVTIFWALYAIVLLTYGFMKKIRMFRLLGIILFFLTAIRIFFEVWSLGQIHRVVSSIVFGAIALAGSFFYAKYKDRIKLL